MKTIVVALMIAFVLPLSAFADGYGWGGSWGYEEWGYYEEGYGWGGAPSYSLQQVAVYPSGPPGSYGGYGGYAGYGCGGCGGYTQIYPMVIGTIEWGCCGPSAYDPQWVYDEWTGTWY